MPAQSEPLQSADKNTCARLEGVGREIEARITESGKTKMTEQQTTQGYADGTYLRDGAGKLYVTENNQLFEVTDEEHLPYVGYPYIEADVHQLPPKATSSMQSLFRLPPEVFPAAHFDTGIIDLGAGHFMKTLGGVTVQDGTLSGLTRTFSVTWLGGFHGGMFAVLADGQGNPIPWSPDNQQLLHVYGVDGRWVGNSDRQDAWVLHHTQADASRAVSVHIFHSWNPDSFQHVLDKWVKAGKSLKELADDATGIAKDVAQVIALGAGPQPAGT